MKVAQSPWNSPGQNTRVGSLSLLQGIFSIQESNQGFLHCRQILYHSSSGKKAQANIAMTVEKGLIFLMIEKA